jgi:hypothetical protein
VPPTSAEVRSSLGEVLASPTEYPPRAQRPGTGEFTQFLRALCAIHGRRDETDGVAPTDPISTAMMTPGGSEVETAPSITLPGAGLRPTGAALAKCSQVAQHYPCVNT